MFKYCHFIILILLAISHDVFNQRDYDYYDYTSEHFLRDRNQRTDRFKVRSFSDISDRSALATIKNIKNKSTEKIVGFGKCLAKCLMSWTKTCGQKILCPWNCLVPGKPVPKPPKQDDSDIELETRAKDQKDKKKSVSLSPGDIVNLIKCELKCLSKYIPHSIISLSQFLGCFVTRCLCV